MPGQWEVSWYHPRRILPQDNSWSSNPGLQSWNSTIPTYQAFMIHGLWWLSVTKHTTDVLMTLEEMTSLVFISLLMMFARVGQRIIIIVETKGNNNCQMKKGRLRWTVIHVNKLRSKIEMNTCSSHGKGGMWRWTVIHVNKLRSKIEMNTTCSSHGKGGMLRWISIHYWTQKIRRVK